MIRITALLAIAAVVALAQTDPALPPAGRGSKTPAAVQATPAPAHKAAPPAGLPSYKDLRYPELRPIAAPRMESVTLPNGLRLYLLEDHELPLINGTVMVRTGSLFDPPGKIGLAALTSQALVNGGTTNRPGDDVFRRFQNLGAEIGGKVTENSVSISFSALKENADEALDILKDALTAPDFQQEHIDLAKMRVRNTIAHRNDDGAAILRREFLTAIFGKSSPYGAQIEYANLDRINRGDLVGFYQRYYFPGNVMVALEGDFDSASMKSRIETLFGDWKAEQSPVPEFPQPSNVGYPGRFLAAKKDLQKAFLTVGQVGGDYLDKDYPALQIMAAILGEGQRGRLNQRMRALGESLSAKWEPGFGHPGLFEVSGSINPFRTTLVLQAIGEELNNLRASEVTEQELKTAKDAALNSLVFTYDNQLSMMPRLIEYEYFNFPKDYIQQYQKGLENVTRADVLRVARERLDPAKMTTVVVANPTAFELPLEHLGGTVTPIDLTIPPPKPEAVLGDPVSQRRGRELLTRAQQAMGGADKLAAVTDYVQESAYQFDASQGGAQVAVTERWLAPGNLRQDSVLLTGKYSVYYDGKAGWLATVQGSSVLAGTGLKQVQSDLFRILFPLMLSDRAPSRKVNALDDNTVEISEGPAQIVKLVFDPGTGLLKNMLYDAPTENGPIPVIDTYTDYRDVGGMKLPFKVAISVSGQKFQEVTIKNIQLNTGLKVQDLERRP
jgi:zinc protease